MHHRAFAHEVCSLLPEILLESCLSRFLTSEALLIYYLVETCPNCSVKTAHLPQPFYLLYFSLLHICFHSLVSCIMVCVFSVYPLQTISIIQGGGCCVFVHSCIPSFIWYMVDGE